MKGWKTIIANGMLLLASLLEGFDVINISEADQSTIVLGIVAVVNIVLRLVTTTPVGKKA